MRMMKFRLPHIQLLHIIYQTRIIPLREFAEHQEEEHAVEFAETSVAVPWDGFCGSWSCVFEGVSGDLGFCLEERHCEVVKTVTGY